MGYLTARTMKKRSQWLKQANEAAKVMQKKGYKNMNEFADKDKENCSKLIQAWDALGMEVDKDLIKRCGIDKLEKVI